MIRPDAEAREGEAFLVIKDTARSLFSIVGPVEDCVGIRNHATFVSVQNGDPGRWQIVVTAGPRSAQQVLVRARRALPGWSFVSDSFAEPAMVVRWN